MIHIVYRLAQAVQLSPDDINQVPKGDLGNPKITIVLQFVFGLFGAIALLIVTLAGFKYVISQGNPQETAKAKNTILYALVGLAVSIFAFTIVSFVVSRIV